MTTRNLTTVKADGGLNHKEPEGHEAGLVRSRKLAFAALFLDSKTSNLRER